ncbi:hypothetical protein B0J14DRAFT_684056 [Halenospora varia]|nr:hypothetical protein B0J14DRAFT_684056 [Halenospora varia]
MSYDTTHSALLPARTKWILTSTEALSQSHFEWYNRLIYSSDEEMIALALAVAPGEGNSQLRKLQRWLLEVSFATNSPSTNAKFTEIQNGQRAAFEGEHTEAVSKQVDNINESFAEAARQEIDYDYCGQAEEDPHEDLDYIEELQSDGSYIKLRDHEVISETPAEDEILSKVKQHDQFVTNGKRGRRMIALVILRALRDKTNKEGMQEYKQMEQSEIEEMNSEEGMDDEPCTCCIRTKREENAKKMVPVGSSRIINNNNNSGKGKRLEEGKLITMQKEENIDENPKTADSGHSNQRC